MGLTNFPNGAAVAGVEVTPSVAIGGTVIIGAGTVATGLASVEAVVVSLANSGTAAGDPYTVIGRPGSRGNVVVEVKQDDDRLATTAGTVHVVAYGS